MIYIAKEYERAVIFRLGRYAGMRGPGLYVVLPFLESHRKVDIRTNTVAVQPQEAITKDSVTVKVDAVLWYKLSNPGKAMVSVADPHTAVYQVTQTSLRNIIGQHKLDEVLRERDAINSALLKIVDDNTEKWGISVELIEIKDVEIPEGMQRAMAREAEASREKRARLIKSEAELEAANNLNRASAEIMKNPMSLELRRMQMIAEIGAENNTTTVILLPSEFVTLAKHLGDYLEDMNEKQKE
ncbi:MAG: slipin family protein [Anaerolineales bacterium]|nr:slipin family protein [Anaerolineales bacterium]